MAVGPHHRSSNWTIDKQSRERRMKTSTLAVVAETEIKDVAQPPDATSGAPVHGPDGANHGVEDPPNTPSVLLDSLAPIDWAGVAGSWAARLLSLVAGVLLWHLACNYKLNFFINFENVPAPLVVLNALIGHIHETKFYIHIIVSIKRILIGFALATAIGICLGVAMGRSRFARDVVTPYIEILRPIPAVAWIPLAILMWPTEESSIIYITFLGALFPIILNTVHGVEQTPEVLVRAAQSLGASALQIFWHVVMPAALPSIATGLAIGMGVSWFSLLAGEIISGQYGIGYFTWNAYSLINYPDIVVGMLVIGLLGTLSTQAVRKITQPLLSWQRKSR
jgi:NitT/TauT family transport system permease protein